MSYSQITCIHFTLGQIERMQAALNTAAGITLWSVTNLLETGVTSATTASCCNIQINLVNQSNPSNCASNGSILISVANAALPIIYKWYNNNNSLITGTTLISNLTAGVYQLNVCDANGCSTWAFFELQGNVPPTLNGEQDHITCQGTGQLCPDIQSGAGPFTSSWANGFGQVLQTSYCATNLNVGWYTLTITDANGCTATSPWYLVNVASGTSLFAATASNPVNASCTQSCNGSATASASGGVAPYSYDWNGDAINDGATPNNLCAGVQTVHVTDAEGCSANASITIGLAPPMSVTFNSAINASCTQSCNGSATASATGGVAPYSYDWNGDAINDGATPNNLCAGVQTVHVTDALGCSANASVTIGLNPPISITFTSITNTSCYGFTDGSVTAAASGGHAPYTYNWSNGQSTATISNLAAGAYTCTVTDNLGCTGQQQVVVMQFGNPPITVGDMVVDSPANSTTWTSTTFGSNEIFIDGDLLIAANDHLYVSNLTIRFTPGHGVKVNPTSLFYTTNVTLDAICGAYWDGVTVEADASGRGRFVGSCTIKHALVGIANHPIVLPSIVPGNDYPLFDNTTITQESTGLNPGGYIQLSNSTFTDNKRDLDLRNYSPTSNQYDVTAKFTNCLFEISSGGLPIAPTLTEQKCRIFLHTAGRVVFDNCNIINNNAAYLSNYWSTAGNLQYNFTGLFATNSFFRWNGNTNGNATNGQISHFVQGIYSVGFPAYTYNALVDRTAISNTNFTNLHNAEVMNGYDVSVLGNKFYLLDGTTWTVPQYTSENVEARALWIRKGTAATMSYTVADNLVDFDQSIKQKSSGIVCTDTRGIANSQMHLVYHNTILGCRYGLYLPRRNKGDALFSAGLRYECNTFGDGTSDKNNMRDVYVLPYFTIGGVQTNSSGVNPMQANWQNNLLYGAQSAANSFVNSTSTYTCNDIRYSWQPLNQGYRYHTSETSDVSQICSVGLQSVPQNTNCGVLQQISVNDAAISKNIATQNLSQSEALYSIIVDGGNTADLRDQVTYGTLAQSYSLYLQMMSHSPGLSELVMCELIKKEADMPATLLTLILAANPTAAKSRAVWDYLDARMQPLDEYQRAFILQGNTVSSTQELLEMEITKHRNALSMATNTLVQNWSDDAAVDYTISDRATLLNAAKYSEDLYEKAQLLCMKGDWQGGIALLADTKNQHLLTKLELAEVSNLLQLLQIESDIVTLQGAVATASQISILQTWYSDYANSERMKAAYMLCAYAGICHGEETTEEDDGGFDPRSYHLSSIGKDLPGASAYPNPAHDHVIVDLNKHFGKTKSVKVTAADGRVVSENLVMDDLNQLLVPLQNVLAGTYFISLHDGGGKLMQTISIVVE